MTCSDPASRGGTRPRRKLSMPAAHVFVLLRDVELRRLHEIDRDEPGDVGNAELVSSDKLSFREFAVQELQGLGPPRLIDFRPLRHLRHLQLGHTRMLMTKDRLYRAVKPQLDAAVPHFYFCDLDRVAAEQIRLRMLRLEINADR